MWIEQGRRIVGLEAEVQTQWAEGTEKAVLLGVAENLVLVGVAAPLSHRVLQSSVAGSGTTSVIPLSFYCFLLSPETSVETFAGIFVETSRLARSTAAQKFVG